MTRIDWFLTDIVPLLAADTVIDEIPHVLEQLAIPDLTDRHCVAAVALLSSPTARNQNGRVGC
jgi:hypothetical protein